MALDSRIDKMTGLLWKRALHKRLYSAKETYNFIDLTNRSHPLTFQQTEEIGLEIITTANFPTNFHGSPRTYQTGFLRSPKNFWFLRE